MEGVERRLMVFETSRCLEPPGTRRAGDPTGTESTPWEGKSSGRVWHVRNQRAGTYITRVKVERGNLRDRVTQSSQTSWVRRSQFQLLYTSLKILLPRAAASACAHSH